jgi:hypothetical protein
MNLFDHIKVFMLKMLLKVLGVLFNRTDEIDKRITEVDKMHSQGRIINDSFLDEKIAHDFINLTQQKINPNQLLYLKHKIQKITSETGYYPSPKQMEFFIFESQPIKDTE